MLTRPSAQGARRLQQSRVCVLGFEVRNLLREKLRSLAQIAIEIKFADAGTYEPETTQVEIVFPRSSALILARDGKLLCRSRPAEKAG